MKKKGFTLIELMVVVLIVGILAAAAVPMMRGRMDAAKWSEGKAGAGTIATAIRAYCADHPTYSTAPTLSDLGIATTDLDGTYFTNDAYKVTSASCNNGVPSFVITVTAGDSKRTDKPSSPASMTLTVNAGGPATWN